MTPQEIIEGNKLIAEFMGRKGKVNAHLYWVNVPSVKWVTIEQMQFHSSWDWLMPVAEKIMDYCFENDGEEDLITKFYDIRDTIPDIHRTWSACIDFIRWYNQNKEK